MSGDHNNFCALCDKIIKISGHNRPFFSMSMGADSIAMFLRCLESGKFDMGNGVYHYYYWFPDIPWVEDYIDYFTSKYGVRITQTPSTICLEDIATWRYQSPARAAAINEINRSEPGYLYLKSKDKIAKFVRLWANIGEDAPLAIGVKQGDSPRRRILMRRQMGYSANQNKWYPIWDFENRDVIDIIRRHGLKMPYDYDLFGISFENIDYRFSSVIRDKCPQTWERIKSAFPMVETIISRYEFYHPEWKSTKGIFYGKFDTLKPVRPL